MDGVHDMGGTDGFGKVEPEANEPVFHHRWEGRVLAMSRAIGVFRAWTIDSSRYAIELRVTSLASCDSLQPSVSAGRIGTTR